MSDKGQVTIPKALRERLGIRPGDRLVFVEEAGRLIASKVVEDDVVSRVYGRLGLGRPTDDLMDELRGPAA